MARKFSVVWNPRAATKNPSPEYRTKSNPALTIEQSNPALTRETIEPEPSPSNRAHHRIEPTQLNRAYRIEPTQSNRAEVWNRELHSRATVGSRWALFSSAQLSKKKRALTRDDRHLLVIIEKTSI